MIQQIVHMLSLFLQLLICVFIVTVRFERLGVGGNGGVIQVVLDGIEPSFSACKTDVVGHWTTGPWSRKNARQATLCRKRKERESNPQALAGRPGSSGVPSPIGLPFHSSCREF